MRSPIFQVQAALLPAAQRPRLVPGWRPAIAPITADTREPDLSAPALGIAFSSGPGQAEVGSTFSCTFQLLAWPDPLCDCLAVGVEIAFLEGESVVGTGKVIAVSHSDGA